ncbi:hypothetical protein [Saccharopolyspora flava]|uniref:PE family protein n=1 Tax=Saccharopolyspora flava TaxID=95161 RepID=A0A1I6SYQ5_9PSEU|nr:hypothetical protein [Saccharopolyspora flava]SFS81998.1 hypothetical protein SAMN05660874_03552 [Saccharopolyspora flava]
MSPQPTSWQNVSATADMITVAGHRLHEGTRAITDSPAEAVRARDALLDLSAASARLARQLDLLAADSGGAGAEPPEVHVALDQAAAAAEDLGNCTRVAARAIEDELGGER